MNNSKAVIFVFGSNLAGRHGAGAAYVAHIKHGAIYGQGEGLQGSCYAVPTKDKNIRRLKLEEIKKYVERFLIFAKANTDKHFYITALGTGLAGYKHADIAPFFKDSPINCALPPEWRKINEN